jgi:hypothetical protein
MRISGSVSVVPGTGAPAPDGGPASVGLVRQHPDLRHV